MAFIEMSLFSKCLMRTVPVNVVLPVDKLASLEEPEREEKPFKTLYLLHGVYGSSVDWVNGTRIQRYAEEYDLAVVMPAGENSFYVDREDGHHAYGSFVGRELVELTRRLFPLSRKREDTFIGGLSMGGFGAMRNGLKYSDTFGCIVALSGSYRLEEMAGRTRDDVPLLESRRFAQSCFGDLTTLLGSDRDPKQLARDLQKSGKPFPKIYMACGDQDGLLGVNLEMVRFLREQGAEVCYETGPGAHEWDFWDTYIKKALEWLPTEHSGLGIGSGNVGV